MCADELQLKKRERGKNKKEKDYVEPRDTRKEGRRKEGKVLLLGRVSEEGRKMVEE